VSLEETTSEAVNGRVVGLERRTVQLATSMDRATYDIFGRGQACDAARFNALEEMNDVLSGHAVEFLERMYDAVFSSPARKRFAS